MQPSTDYGLIAFAFLFVTGFASLFIAVMYYLAFQDRFTTVTYSRPRRRSN